METSLRVQHASVGPCCSKEPQCRPPPREITGYIVKQWKATHSYSVGNCVGMYLQNKRIRTLVFVTYRPFSVIDRYKIIRIIQLLSECCHIVAFGKATRHTRDYNFKFRIHDCCFDFCLNVYLMKRNYSIRKYSHESSITNFKIRK